jgi:hypothetical protein
MVQQPIVDVTGSGLQLLTATQGGDDGVVVSR